jgi:hypothetical protein
MITEVRRPRFQPDDQPDETLTYTYLRVVSSPVSPRKLLKINVGIFSADVSGEKTYASKTPLGGNQIARRNWYFLVLMGGTTNGGSTITKVINSNRL